MSFLSPTVRRAAAESTLEFDWLLGYRQLWTFKSLTALTGMSESFLERLWDDPRNRQHISGHEFNAGTGKRMSKRVSRVFVVRLLVTSARYTADQKRDAVTALAREFNAADCQAIAQAFLNAAERKGSR